MAYILNFILMDKYNILLPVFQIKEVDAITLEDALELLRYPVVLVHLYVNLIYLPFPLYSHLLFMESSKILLFFRGNIRMTVLL